MISCRLKGGLGNLMFQIAGVEHMAKFNNLKSCYWNVDYLNSLNRDKAHNPALKHATDYKVIFKNFKWPVGKKPSDTVHLPFHYEKVNVKDNTVYDGFFQSEKYFPNRQFTLNLFEPSDAVKKLLKRYDHILGGTTCSIHVRRGDYLKYGLHKVREMDYFTKAIKEVGDVDRYLIFSDDINWCKENFKGANVVFITDKDYVELFLQSLCTHNIISSSSFSWWGAYLNKNPNKIVIGPKQWFTVDKQNDIIPESWRTI